jgi:hypothetical protein
MEQVSFKVSLDEKSQVRRFLVPQDCSTSYVYLKEKLRSVFGQEIANSGFNIMWQDNEEDIVTVESDEELLIAMNELEGPVYKFNLVPSKVRKLLNTLELRKMLNKKESGIMNLPSSLNMSDENTYLVPK